jgi:hypothetical protein
MSAQKEKIVIISRIQLTIWITSNNFGLKVKSKIGIIKTKNEKHKSWASFGSLLVCDLRHLKQT